LLGRSSREEKEEHTLLRDAEVVELADTPSMALGLLILSKFFIAALLSFTPIGYADPVQNGR